MPHAAVQPLCSDLLEFVSQQDFTELESSLNINGVDLLWLHALLENTPRSKDTGRALDPHRHFIRQLAKSSSACFGLFKQPLIVATCLEIIIRDFESSNPDFDRNARSMLASLAPCVYNFLLGLNFMNAVSAPPWIPQVLAGLYRIARNPYPGLLSSCDHLSCVSILD